MVTQGGEEPVGDRARSIRADIVADVVSEVLADVLVDRGRVVAVVARCDDDIGFYLLGTDDTVLDSEYLFQEFILFLQDPTYLLWKVTI